MRTSTRLASLGIAALSLAVLGRAFADDKPAGLVASLPPIKDEAHPEKDESHLYSVAFSSDGKQVMTVLDKNVHFWDASTWKEIRKHTMKEGERRSVLGLEAKTFVWLGSTFAVCDAESGEPSLELSTKPDWGDVSNFALSADGKTLHGCGSVKGNPAIWSWEYATGKLTTVKLADVNGNFYALAASPDGKLAAAGIMGEARVLVVDLATGKVAKELKTGEHFAKSLAFSPDSKLLAAGGFQEPVRVFDVETGKTVSKIEMNFAACVRFSPDGKYLAASDREEFCLWSVADKKLLGIFTRKGPVKEARDSQGVANAPEQGLAFSPDSKLIAWGCEYEEWGTVRIFEIEGLLKAK